MKTAWSITFVSFIIGVVVGVGLFEDDRAVAHVREGYVVQVDESGLAIGLADSPDEVGLGYDISVAVWRQEGEDAWNIIRPQSTCVQHGQKARLGVVQIVPSYKGAPGMEIVAWLE